MQNRRIYSFDNFELDVGNRQLLRDGRPMPLPAKAFDLLQTLLENNGRLVEKDELFSSVWRDQIVEESNLTVHVSQIRKALGENKNKPRYIETVPGYGYRFVGEVDDADGDELVFETETFSRITIDREDSTDAIILDDEKHTQGDSGKIADHQKVIDPVRRSRLPLAMLAIGGAAILLASAFSVNYFRGKKSALPYEKINLARLTNSGKVSRAAISPDGKYIAYVLGEREGNSLWIQQVGTASNVLILPPVVAEVYALTFTPDGAHIYYSLFADGKANLELYRVSSLGGIIDKIPNTSAMHIAFSPDGGRFAYAESDSAAGQNYLIIADSDGGNQHIISAKAQPNTFEQELPVVAWSPDGETIACVVYHFDDDASYSSIVGINIKDGSEKLLSEQRWYNLVSLDWLKNGSGLLVSSGDKVSGGNQVQFLSFPGGEVRQITNDLSEYSSLSATGDGKSFITVKTDTINGIYVSVVGTDEFKEIASEIGGLHPFVWASEGKIIFRSIKDGVSNLWITDTDGRNRRQLTTNARVGSGGMCIAPSGKYLVFQSWRSGKSILWRVDADGNNLRQLTDGESDMFPRCSPDGQSVIYQGGLLTKPVLWKIPIEGGEPVQLIPSFAKWPAISNDVRQISYLFMSDGKWRFGITASESGLMQNRIDVPATFSGNMTRWSPDDRSLLYISSVGKVGNIWSLPLDVSVVKHYTNFTSQSISDFSLSPDGKYIAVSRMSSTSDAVLISNSR